MKIGNKNYNHIEVYDETGQLIVMIDDEHIVEYENITVKFCESDLMFYD